MTHWFTANYLQVNAIKVVDDKTMEIEPALMILSQGEGGGKGGEGT